MYIFKLWFNSFVLSLSPALKILISPARWYMPLRSPFCTFYNFTSFTVAFLIPMITPKYVALFTILCCINPGKGD